MYKNLKFNKGFTLLEMLLVLTIIVIITAIVLPSLSNFRNERNLNNATEDIVSILNKARNDTIGSLDSNAYGVHFESSKATYFIAPTYNSTTTTNIPVYFDSSVTIPSTGGINLNGAGSDVIFTKLSGDTTNYGTIVVQLSADSTRQKTVTINKTGAVSSN